MITGVAQPVLAQVKDDRERQLRVFRKMMRFTCFVSFPAMLGLSLVAPELITIAITDRWIESAKMLQILCISGAFIPIISLCSNLLISKGKSDIYMWNTIGLVTIQLIVSLVIYPYGIYTMIVVYAMINIAFCIPRDRIPAIGFGERLAPLFVHSRLYNGRYLYLHRQLYQYLHAVYD